MKNFKLHIPIMNSKYRGFLISFFMIFILSASFTLAAPTYKLDLRSNEDFVVLAGSTITGIPPVVFNGIVGLSPAAGSYIAGFDGTSVNGILYVVDASGPAGSVVASSLLTTAKGDLTISYNDAAGRTPVPTGNFLNPGSGNIGGLNLVAGLYKFTSNAGITGSDLTLTGNSSDVWIFQIASSLNVGVGIKVILAGGAQAANIFWQVGTSATLLSYSVFKGTILADQSISMGTGATLDGRALAFSGAVTMASGATSNIALLTSIFVSDSIQINFGNIRNGSNKRDSIIVTNIGGADLIIDSIKSSNLLYSFTPSSGTISPDASMKFYITFSPLSDSVKNGFIYFYHNADNIIDSISVSGTGVSSRFLSTFYNINFGNVRNDLTKKDSITVSNTGTADLIISSVTSLNAQFTVTPSNRTLIPGTSSKFYITFAPVADGLQNANIIFNHNAMNPKDTVTLSGTGVSPLFSSNIDTINFGSVRNDLTKIDSITVSNPGTIELIISNISNTNNLFNVSPANGTIQPGTSMKFYITFAPVFDGLQNANIIFNHNAKLSKDTITLSGTGVSPLFSSNLNTINFGNVRNNLTKIDSITVSNPGTIELIINNITNSNNLFNVSPVNGTIQPGTTMKFYITFVPVADGLQNANIIFNHNAKLSRDTVTLSGTGVSPLFSANLKTTNFGNVRNDLTKIDSITVSNPGTTDLIISNVTSTNGLFTVIPTSGTIQPGTSMKYYLTFSPLVDGSRTGNIIFYHNAMKAIDSISVRGIGVSPMFSVIPMNLNFYNVNNGTRFIDSVTVINDGTSDLIVSRIESTNSFFTVTPLSVTIEPYSTWKFYITFSPTLDGLQNAYINFYHNAKIPKDSITVSGTGVSPKFSKNPKNLDFGNVFNGTAMIENVTVTNTGTANLEISSFTTSNPNFTLTQIKSIITPGTSKNFRITFSPQVSGLHSGYIYFHHNVGNILDSIFVTGIGIESYTKFSVNPKNLNFGSVKIGVIKDESVTVTNFGSINLIISSITSNAFQYIVTPKNGIIASGASMKFNISFIPDVAGQHNTIILFTHKDGQDSVIVTGNGLNLLNVITIKEALELPVGTEFLIEGIVTRTLGDYTRIQDASGAITIIQNSGVFFNEVQSYDIQMADMIRVQGIMTEQNNLKVIYGTDLTGYQRLSRLNNMPTPVKLNLLDIVNNGEQYESRLITIENILITSNNDLIFYADRSYHVADTSYSGNKVDVRIGKNTNTDFDGMSFKGPNWTFVGVLSQSSTSDPTTGYELTPVLSSDLIYIPTISVDDLLNENQNTLIGNYPNPFNSTTNIQYYLGSTNFVSLKVLNILGNEVARLVNSVEDAGDHSVSLSTSNDTFSLASGVYYYRLEIGSYISTKQMMIIK